jgi:hypothetical protein
MLSTEQCLHFLRVALLDDFVTPLPVLEISGFDQCVQFPDRHMFSQRSIA